MQAFAKNPHFKLRTIPSPPKARFGIHDKKEALFATSTTAGMDEAPVLLSNNLCLLAVAQNYFEVMWSTALECKPEEHSPNS